ncbi:unnamed protein product, partial [Rotaria sp. Silwood1]
MTDSYGCLYVNSFNPSNITSNLIAYDDDIGGNLQFSMTYFLQADTTYILIFTTFGSGVTTIFSVSVMGPTNVHLLRMNFTSIVPTSNTTNRTPMTT